MSHDRSWLGGGGGLVMMKTRCGLDKDHHCHWRESAGCACLYVGAFRATALNTNPV